MSVSVTPATAQQAPVTIVLLRTATGRGTYHFAEFIHERGRIVPFDLGYIDFDDPSDYREMWLGGGVVALDRPLLRLTVEGFVLGAFGEHARGAVYFQPFFLANSRLTPRIGAEAVYFPYVPLNESGHSQHVLERAKVEYSFARVKVGGGYGAYRAPDATWNHKPFVTTTVQAGGLGNFEIWLQRLSGGHASLQVRYVKVVAH